jgi:hypothetical protein
VLLCCCAAVLLCCGTVSWSLTLAPFAHTSMLGAPIMFDAIVFAPELNPVICSVSSAMLQANGQYQKYTTHQKDGRKKTKSERNGH